MSVHNPITNGEVVQGKLLIVKREGDTYLEIVDEKHTRVLAFKQIADADGNNVEQLRMGGKGASGFVRVKNEECRDAVCLDGESATVIAGCEFMDGEIVVRDARGNDKIILDGAIGFVAVGGSQSPGTFTIYTADQDMSVTPPDQAAFHMDGFTGELNLNGNGMDGGRIIMRRQGQETIVIDGDKGEINFLNADFAEDFDLTPTLSETAVEPGMVMVFDEKGDLQPCSADYDSKVAGVISGAGDYSAGIVMDKRKTGKIRKPIALVGKVYCLVDATEAGIEIGDLLTSSKTVGHARKAADPLKAFGASLGKALKPMQKGEIGLLPIVVTLQ